MENLIMGYHTLKRFFCIMHKKKNFSPSSAYSKSSTALYKLKDGRGV
jgi:hypothetical protein